MIQFPIFEAQDLPLFRKWLNSDHVKDFWQETDDEEALRKKFVDELPHRGVWAFTIEKDGERVGFIQYYEATKVGGGWWPNEVPGTFGIDLLIGQTDLIGKGWGVKIIQEFLAFIQSREPRVRSFIIDPNPKNARAIRSFAKAGFVAEGEIITPGGAALLMRKPSLR